MKNAKPVLDLSLYAALFDDLAARDPDLHQFLQADKNWLEALVKTRGMSFIMIDMPEAGKVTDLALSEGQLNFHDLPNTFGAKTESYRPFLYGLYKRVFDETGKLRPDASVSAVRDLRQALYLVKKAKVNCSDAAILAEVEAFRSVDVALRSPSLLWDDDRSLLSSSGDGVIHLADGLRFEPESWADPLEDWMNQELGQLVSCIQAVADNLMKRWKSAFDWREVFPKHGPGSVADAKRGADKYLFPTWPKKLDDLFPRSYFAYSSEYAAWAEAGEPSARLFHEPPVRLLAVPKVLKGPRMVASEPTSHQFIQLGLMRWMRDNLPAPLNHCLDFKDQTPSRDLCLLASKKGDLATVDLSAASDRLSCWTVERIFRGSPDLLDALHASRTRWIFNATKHGDPYYLKLKKYAPMGNGTTFPVQSIVYAIVSIASIIFLDRDRVNNVSILKAAKEVRVFGDDIILPSRAVGPLANALSYLQLKVNRMKTHVNGHFRESCGMDAFNGEEVTPLYLAGLELKDSPEGLISWLDVMKNAKSARLYQLMEAMWAKIPNRYLKGIPVTDRNLGCLTLPSYYGNALTLHPLTRVRFNRKLFRREALCLVKETKPVRGKRETDANLVQYWTDSPKPDSLWESGFVVRDRSKLTLRWVALEA
jgi:hypothetical protein